MKLGSNIHHVKKFSTSEVKGQNHYVAYKCAIVGDAYVLTVWSRVSVVLY